MSEAGKVYGEPRIGRYFEASDYDLAEASVYIINLALGFGWALPEGAGAVVEAVQLSDEQRSNGPDRAAEEKVDEIALEAIDWLNEQEQRECSWEYTMTGDFGLWKDPDRPVLAYVREKR